jgi:hypothetical protein
MEDKWRDKCMEVMVLYFKLLLQNRVTGESHEKYLANTVGLWTENRIRDIQITEKCWSYMINE